jgi:hypothetical protein
MRRREVDSENHAPENVAKTSSRLAPLHPTLKELCASTTQDEAKILLSRRQGKLSLPYQSLVGN